MNKKIPFFIFFLIGTNCNPQKVNPLTPQTPNLKCLDYASCSSRTENCQEGLCVSGVCNSSFPSGICFPGSSDELCKIVCDQKDCRIMESYPIQVDCS